jgi:hypothetical protein
VYADIIMRPPPAEKMARTIKSKAPVTCPMVNSRASSSTNGMATIAMVALNQPMARVYMAVVRWGRLARGPEDFAIKCYNQSITEP